MLFPALVSMGSTVSLFFFFFATSCRLLPFNVSIVIIYSEFLWLSYFSINTTDLDVKLLSQEVWQWRYKGKALALSLNLALSVQLARGAVTGLICSKMKAWQSSRWFFLIAPKCVHPSPALPALLLDSLSTILTEKPCFPEGFPGQESNKAGGSYSLRLAKSNTGEDLLINEKRTPREPGRGLGMVDGTAIWWFHDLRLCFFPLSWIVTLVQALQNPTSRSCCPHSLHSGSRKRGDIRQQITVFNKNYKF